MEVPRLGVKSELQLPDYTTAHSNAKSPTHLTRPGMNPCPHGYQLDSFPLHHNRDSQHFNVLPLSPIQPSVNFNAFLRKLQTSEHFPLNILAYTNQSSVSVYSFFPPCYFYLLIFFFFFHFLDDILFFIFFYFSQAYGSSQAKGHIRAAAALVYATATATQYPSYICYLCHSLWQRWILNSLSEARD